MKKKIDDFSFHTGSVVIAIAKQFTPQQLEQIQKGLPRITGLTWHHCAECGKMELIPTKIHSQFRHTGGKAIWGGGRSE